MDWVQAEAGTDPFATLSLATAATLRAHQPTWSMEARYEALRGAGTRFDRWARSAFDRLHGEGRLATRWRGRAQWQPSPSVSLEAGRDTLHDGFGRRALFRGTMRRHRLAVRLDGGDGCATATALKPSKRPSTSIVDRHGRPRTRVPPVGPLRSDLGRMLVSHRLTRPRSRITGALWARWSGIPPR